MLKVEEVFNSSFDSLLESIFQGSASTKSDKQETVLENIWNYIEIYQEKKTLESQKNQLASMVEDKDKVIAQLHETISNLQLKEKKTQETSEKLNPPNDKQILFLAKICHDLRTPLAGAVGITQLLLDTSLSLEQQKFINIIQNSSNLLLTLINDILNYARITNGDWDLEEIDIDIKSLLQEVIEILGIEAQKKKLKFYYESSPEVPSTMQGDPLRLKQILMNLASNAIKFTTRGEVVIQTRLDNISENQLNLCFVVRDTGIGIPPTEITAIFKPFSQAGSLDTEKHSGTGLGLAISKDLVEKMGGKITVESQCGQGTTFQVTIPLLCKEREANTALTTKMASRFAEKKKDIRILLVEDDEVNQKVNRILLEKSGYYVEVTENGEEAIQVLNKSYFDIVFMDIQMPVMNGFEATESIRDGRSTVLNQEIPIFAMTAYAGKEDKEKCLAVGMNDYISKPLNVSEVEEKFAKWLKPKKAGNSIHGQDIRRLAKHMAIDYENLAQLRKDTQENFAPLVKIFLNSLPPRIDKIKKALKDKDFDQLEEAAHQLKGTAASFYAVGLADLCQKMEQQKNARTLEGAKTLLNLLETEANQVTSALNHEIG